MALKERIIRKLDKISIDYLANPRWRASGYKRRLVPQLDHLASGYLVHEDITAADREIIEAVSHLALVNATGIHSLLQSVEHIVARDVPGAMVECGVFRGGCAMAVALKLLQLGCTDRDIYLFDTFTGAPRPTRSSDRDAFGANSAQELWDRAKRDPVWEAAWFRHVFEEARDAVVKTGYPEERLKMVPGLVEDTVPSQAPEVIALLRLDTDWYESTLHELEHLYPRLQMGGVLVVDDYGAFTGAREATDEYFARAGNSRPLLQRVNYTVRQAIKS